MPVLIAAGRMLISLFLTLGLYFFEAANAYAQLKNSVRLEKNRLRRRDSPGNDTTPSEAVTATDDHFQIRYEWNNREKLDTTHLHVNAVHCMARFVKDYTPTFNQGHCNDAGFNNVVIAYRGTTNTQVPWTLPRGYLIQMLAQGYFEMVKGNRFKGLTVKYYKDFSLLGQMNFSARRSVAAVEDANVNTLSKRLANADAGNETVDLINDGQNGAVASVLETLIPAVGEDHHYEYSITNLGSGLTLPGLAVISVIFMRDVARTPADPERQDVVTFDMSPFQRRGVPGLDIYLHGEPGADKENALTGLDIIETLLYLVTQFAQRPEIIIFFRCGISKGGKYKGLIEVGQGVRSGIAEGGPAAAEIETPMTVV